jgi:uracil-DNA glycosylase family 4
MSEQRRLTMLEERRPALETCAYCPKLSRSACPISDAEASETVTPWGKISATFDEAREATPATPEHAALAWACSGCLTCRELCELKNPVAETLIAARHAYRERGLAPAASERVVENTPRRMERSGKRIRALRERYRHRDDAPTAVLLGNDLGALPTLDAVAERIRTTYCCDLCPSRTQAVPGEGNPDADLVLIGEGPGATEDATGRPFVGQAGQLLESILDAIEVPRSSVYITNIVKCRPPQNRKPLPDEIAACLPYLHRHLENLRPKVIMPMGGTAGETINALNKSMG